MINVVIYARYSSSKQQEQSIDAQLRICHEYAGQHDYVVIGEYCDYALSGKNDNRPEFQRMIRDSANGSFQYILVWKLDRFSRSTFDSAIYKRKLGVNGVRVLSVTEPVNADSRSRLTEVIFEAMAEDYIAALSENVKRGMKQSALQAHSTGGLCPLGFKIENKRLVIDERKAGIVRYIYNQYADGVGKKEIIDNLNELGYKTAKNKPFTIASFSKMLVNKKYIGIYCYNNDVEIKDGCPRIIDDELWERVQKRLAANSRRSGGAHKAKVEYLLSGKVFCGKCSEAMVGDSSRSATGLRYYYYTCRNKKFGNACDKKRESKEQLETEVITTTVNIVLQKKNLDKLSKFLSDDMLKRFGSADAIAALEKDIARIEREMQKCFDMALRSDALSEIAYSRAEDLKLQKEYLQIKLSQSQNLSSRQYTVDNIKARLVALCNGDINDPAYRRRIVDNFINVIYVTDDKLLICYNLLDTSSPEAVPFDAIADRISYSANTNAHGSPWRITVSEYRRPISVIFSSRSAVQTTWRSSR